MNKLTKKKNVSRTKSRKKVSKSMKNMRGGFLKYLKKKFTSGEPVYSTIKKKSTQQTKLPPKPPSINSLRQIILPKNQYKIEKLHITANSYAQKALKKLNLPNSNKKTYEIYPNLYQKALTIQNYNPKNIKIDPKHIENARNYILRHLDKHANTNNIENLFIKKARYISSIRSSKAYSQLLEKNEAQTSKNQKKSNQSIYSSLKQIKSGNPYEESSKYEDPEQFKILPRENPYVIMSSLS